MLWAHGCEHACVCAVNEAGTCLRGHMCMHHEYVGVLCTAVRALKREPSCLTVRADRVTFSKGSATSDGAGLSACWQEVSGAADS